MKKKRVKIFIILAAVMIGGYFGLTGIISYIETNHEKQVAALNITNVDIANIQDGTYSGRYKIFPVDVQVKVTVKDHKIQGIQLVKHKNGKGDPAEIIPGKVIETQSLDVDVVSGATSSSKVILKAIENALNSAIN